MLDRIREARKIQAGYTLLELLLVIVILGILSAIVVFAVGGITDRGEVAACKAEVKTIAVAEEAFYAKNNPGQYTDLAGLVTAKLLRPGTPVYVASASDVDGSLTMKTTGVPAGCTAA
jgi:prepilin-type N-terminal cleavage/methylation domain-containing protein